MKRRIFYADSSGKVEALGMQVDAKPSEIKIYVNGVELTETVVLERIEIYIERG